MPRSCRTPREPGETIGARGLVVLIFALLLPFPASAAQIADAQKLFKSGEYTKCLEMVNQALADQQWGEGWWILKIRSELTTGQYAQALKSQEESLTHYDSSLALRMLGYDVLRANDRPDDASEVLSDIKSMAQRTPWRYDDASSRVWLGRALLRGGTDARQVLEQYFDKAKKDAPDSPEPYLASGEMALEKHDYALAAEAFQDAAKRAPEDPAVYYGLARAYDNDADRATAALNKALELNPHHVDSLLFQADNLIDREDYAGAEALLKQVLEVNPKHPRAWAYRAVLSHLSGDKKKEESNRAEALSSWKTNPEVDFLIGQKISQKYRFSEGSAYQRKALEFVANYEPAKEQLCQDLMRLGKEEEGWELASQVFKDDPYNVLAYNLVTLHDHLAKFQSLRDPAFLVRMDPREAEIYGQEALKLLDRAKAKLCAKYGVELTEPITVEIFPQQQDFAIRTFGLPGGAGFLGVCFGPVVTVNSPASRAGHPSNWQAVLWHEFCHTVTLHKTRNKMPRWLSEGISVYEEKQEVPAWGQAMNPQYRDLILSGGITPVSKLSGAFLKPPTPMHLQFAYYESSMVVEYVVSHFGAPALREVLSDLADDVPINDALARHTQPIEKLDEDFDKWLRDKAAALAPKADLEHPKLPLDADSTAMTAWSQQHPTNFWGLLGLGRALIAEHKWAEAKKPLEQAIALYPTATGAGGPYLLLAAAHRGLGETQAEQAFLEKHVALDADAIEPRVRLADIAVKNADWRGVRNWAEQILAINPLIPAPHRYLAQAAEALGERAVAIRAHRTLLLLDPLDRAEHHYRLAQLLMQEKQLPDARRQAVEALEEAPRYRAAHALLLEIVGKMQPATGTTTRPVTTAPATRATKERP